jgi:hypothetical protein
MLLTYVILFVFTRWKGNKSSEKGENEKFFFIMEYYTLLAIIPNLLLTDTEHFLFSLPLIMVLLNYLFVFKNPISIAIFAILIFLYEGNSSDILGHSLANKLDEMGMLGISNLFIMAFSMYVVLKKRIFSSFEKQQEINYPS